MSKMRLWSICHTLYTLLLMCPITESVGNQSKPVTCRYVGMDRDDQSVSIATAVCHCQNQQACDSVTGFCTSGQCDIGWQFLPQCQIECAEGRFGQNCTGVCHCPVGDTCMKTNGLCSSGVCLLGWSGPSCQTRLPVMSVAPDVQVLGAEDVELRWIPWSASRDIGQGPIAFYQVQYSQSGSSKWVTADTVAESGLSKYSNTVKCLLPGTKYNFRLVLAMDMQGKHKLSVPSPATNYILTALPGTTHLMETMEPLPPMNLKAEDITKSSVQLSWQPPPSSPHVSYMLRVEMEQTYSVERGVLILHTVDSGITLKDLEPASLYKINLTAHNRHMSSQPIVLTLWTLLKSLPNPTPPILLKITDSHLYARVYPADYSHKPAPLYKLVVEDLTKAYSCPTKESLSHKLTSGVEVEIVGYSTSCSKDLAYYCTKVLENDNLPVEGHVVVVGDNTTTADVWNAALFPEHEYVLWVCLDSPLPGSQQVTCAKSGEHAIPAKGILYPNNINVAAIVCSVVFSFLFLILLILCLIYCYRKHKQKKTKYRDIISYHLGPTLYDTLIQRKNTTLTQTFLPETLPKLRNSPLQFHSQDDIDHGEGQACVVKVNDSGAITSHAVVCKELVDIYERKEFVIDQEFKSLPEGFLEESVIAMRPENQEFNRSSKVLPYDKNRVRLLRKTAIDNDYVNASNVKTHMHTFFVVSQAPLDQTVVGFWRLVWEQNVDCVVMLMSEEGYGEYWPEGGRVVKFGEVGVELLAMSHTAHYTVRWLQISREQDEDTDVRNLAHFQYHTWTQTATPHHPIPFLDFTQRIHDTHQHLYHILVHCKLGAGRSGLFVALSALLYEGKLTNKVDIIRAVHILRHERPGLVSNIAQYKFLYEALMEAFHYRDTRFQESKYEFIYENMLSVSTPNSRSIIATEFDCLTVNQRRSVLNKVFKWTDYSSYYSPAKLSSPVKCGVPNHVVVGDSSCELLVAHMDSHREKGHFLVSLYPCKEQQVSDFWHMVFAEHCSAVVMVTEPDSSQPVYWPAQGETMRSGELVVRTVATELDPTNAICVRQMEVCVGGSSRRVEHVQWCVWPQCREVPGVEQMLQLLELVRGSAGRLVVHSAHGVSRAALFCVVWFCVERIEEEGVVDVYRTTRYTRSALSAALTNLEQYRFVYKIVKEKLRRERQNTVNQSEGQYMSVREKFQRNLINQSVPPHRRYTTTESRSDLSMEKISMANLMEFDSSKSYTSEYQHSTAQETSEVKGSLYPSLSQHRTHTDNAVYQDKCAADTITTQDRGDVKNSSSYLHNTHSSSIKTVKQQGHTTKSGYRDIYSGKVQDIGNCDREMDRNSVRYTHVDEKDSGCTVSLTQNRDSGNNANVNTELNEEFPHYKQQSPFSPSTPHSSMYPTDSSDSTD